MSSDGTAGPPVLELDHATIGYDGRAVVPELDLVVRAGEVVAVLGANGSGKSTVVRAVFGLAQLQSGALRVFGTDRDAFGDWQRIGYVPQAQTVGGALPTTVREVVTSGRLAHRRPWRRLSADDHDAIATAIAAVGLGPRERTPIAELSGGQQRRALIARALAARPEVLVLDEPTAGVDVRSQAAFAGILGDLCARGMTIVVVTHELGPLAPLTTRAVVLADGQVTFDGRPDAAPAAGWAGDHHHHHEHHGAPGGGWFGER